MKKLTKVEEQVMHIIWSLGRCTVRDIRDEMGDPPPPHSTISSVARILEDKGFLDHKAYGRTYEYFPIITKAEYSKFTLKNFAKDYFEGSYKRLVSFLAKEEKIDSDELSEIINLLDKTED